MLRVKQEIDMKWHVKYHSRAQWILQLCCAYPKTQNNKSGEPELKKVGDKPLDKNELILHNTIINERQNKIADTRQGF